MTVKTPATPASKIERTPITTPGGPKAKEEKIFVTVRVRPLNRLEEIQKDQVAWECTDDNTIVLKNPSHERTSASYTFDKVFTPNCLTERVYEEGAKDVALSALTGINATIFAYGQTSSGKTFTMRGITESAVNDIYKHIRSTPERDFVVKISAIEIYNEIVRDLLKPESGPLRLLDDPEKGTVVEKLVEETATDGQHLRHIISICEAQRQVGETALNDASSRSHQIIRLTIESSLRANSGCVKSFFANLNFVDLAGSERASQTHADGIRLKEGSHINRSLLTLTTVIRKLSEGKKNAHIPYRDSKLTRILQLSLGGNARTAIICTMSPASSHVEQSRKTLSFATSAKEVTNSAKVNMVISDKQLVRHLQKEVARLEAELRTPEPSAEALLMEKEMEIQKLKSENEELKRKLDERKALDERQGMVPCDSHNRVVKCLSFSGPLTSPENGLCDEAGTLKKLRKSLARQPMRQSMASPSILVQEIRKLEKLQEQLGEEANRAIEVLQKEVASHKLGNQDVAETVAKLQAELREMRAVRSTNRELDVAEMVNNQNTSATLKEEISRLHLQENSIANLEAQLEIVQKSIDKLVWALPSNNASNEETPKSKMQPKKKKVLPLQLSNSVNKQHFIKSPCSPLSSSQSVLESEPENRPPENDDITSCEMSQEAHKVTPTRSEDGDEPSSREGTPCYHRSNSVNVRKIQKMFKNAAEENIRSIRAYVTELKERVAKLQYQKKLLVCQVLELEANDNTGNETAPDENSSDIRNSPASWHIFFDNQRKQIIQLWDLCQVSIIHRTQFYLLFKGDPADQIYLEVEMRRLTWLQQHLAELGNASPAQVGDEPAISLSSCMRNLKHERENLAKRVNSRLAPEERDRLYRKFRIPLDGKQRKLQLIYRLWIDPNDMEHIQESAEIVAKLIGFCETGHASKEMFELNFVLPSDKKPWLLGWSPISNLLNL
ncbi:kinesin-like protein NACK1 [Nymphaea colorata]|nr:kinesin-like protein NACK1 [Nymphaea colorata]